MVYCNGNDNATYMHTESLLYVWMCCPGAAMLYEEENMDAGLILGDGGL